jgi:hypothetical protein
MATALVEAATWVGCTDVRVERVMQDDLRDPLIGALKRSHDLR